MPEDESLEKSIQDSQHSQHKSQSSDHSDNESESKNESPDKIIEDIIKVFDIHTEEGTGEVGLLKASSKELQQVKTTPEKIVKYQVEHLGKEWMKLTQVLQTSLNHNPKISIRFKTHE